jgi:ABC-type phosphate transport system substrate-binding protein
MLTTETTGGPTAYFNDGSSDLMKCVSDLPGAIGYADADQLEGSSNILNVHALKYNGVEPRRTKIRNGEYDFYSNQWLYGNPARTAYSTIKTTWIQPLMAFAANPSKIPASKAKFWATQDEMWFNKSNDSLYPGFIGPLDPQLP